MSSAKRQNYWRRSSSECSKLCERSRNSHATISKVVGSQLCIWRVLMTTARRIGGQADPEKFEEMDRELTEAIGDFDHAVNVEALRLVKRNGKHLLTQTW